MIDLVAGFNPFKQGFACGLALFQNGALPGTAVQYRLEDEMGFSRILHEVVGVILHDFLVVLFGTPVSAVKHGEGIDHRRNVAPRLEQGSGVLLVDDDTLDRKSTRLNSSHVRISYAVFCLKKKRKQS